MDNLCWRCRKEIKGKPCKCYCGSRLCRKCYKPHIQSHAFAEALDDALDEDTGAMQSEQDAADSLYGFED